MKKSVITALLALLAAPLTAQTSMTLEEAQNYALENAWNMQSAQLEIKRANQLYWQNLATGLPQASATGQYVWNTELAAMVADMNGDGILEELTFGTEYQGQGTFTASQLLFNGSYFIGLMAAEVLKEGAEINLKKTEAALMRDVAQSYHIALLAKESAQLAHENMEYLGQLFQETKAMNEAGFVGKTDVDQAELMYNNASSGHEFAKGQLNVAMAMLKTRMNMPQEETLTLTQSLDNLVLTAAAAPKPEGFDPANNLDVQEMATRVQGAKLNFRNKQMGYLPTVSAAYQQQLQYMSTEANLWGTAGVDIPSSLVAIQVNVPIWTSGSGRAATQVAKIEYHQAQNGLRQLEEGMAVQYQSVLNDLEFAGSDLLNQKRNIELSKKILENTRKSFAQGAASSLELVQAETQYRQALQAYFGAAQLFLDKRAELDYITTK